VERAGRVGHMGNKKEFFHGNSPHVLIPVLGNHRYTLWCEKSGKSVSL
jgi:hypothetical protein